jgi:hypothetical protein
MDPKNAEISSSSSSSSSSSKRIITPAQRPSSTGGSGQSRTQPLRTRIQRTMSQILNNDEDEDDDDDDNLKAAISASVMETSDNNSSALGNGADSTSNRNEGAGQRSMRRRSSFKGSLKPDEIEENVRNALKKSRDTHLQHEEGNVWDEVANDSTTSRQIFQRPSQQRPTASSAPISQGLLSNHDQINSQPSASAIPRLSRTLSIIMAVQQQQPPLLPPAPPAQPQQAAAQRRVAAIAVIQQQQRPQQQQPPQPPQPQQAALVQVAAPLAANQQQQQQQPPLLPPAPPAQPQQAAAQRRVAAIAVIQQQQRPQQQQPPQPPQPQQAALVQVAAPLAANQQQQQQRPQQQQLPLPPAPQPQVQDAMRRRYLRIQSFDNGLITEIIERRDGSLWVELNTNEAHLFKFSSKVVRGFATLPVFYNARNDSWTFGFTHTHIRLQLTEVFIHN